MGKIVLDLVKRHGHREAALILPTRPLPLYSMVTSSGIAREVGKGYDWHGTRRGSAEFVLLQYTIAGSGMLTYDGESREVRPGEAMLLFFPHDNRYWLPAGGEWEFFYICMNGRDIARLWRDMIARRGPLVPLADDGAALTQAVAIVEDVLDKQLASPFTASARAYALTMALLDELVPKGEIADAPPY
ncbi:MAG: AraC family ligand binding domain-containing protein, partial [Planctomycetes bacterium]|nr:AraC family ligand binding domain-containing protein [Planctomycetota bacterium]